MRRDSSTGRCASVRQAQCRPAALSAQLGANADCPMRRVPAAKPVTHAPADVHEAAGLDLDAIFVELPKIASPGKHVRPGVAAEVEMLSTCQRTVASMMNCEICSSANTNGTEFLILGDVDRQPRPRIPATVPPPPRGSPRNRSSRQRSRGVLATTHPR